MWASSLQAHPPSRLPPPPHPTSIFANVSSFFLRLLIVPMSWTLLIQMARSRTRRAKLRKTEGRRSQLAQEARVWKQG